MSTTVPVGEREAFDWEAEYRTGNTPWDKGAASPALLEALERVTPTGRVLVPGCGLGHDVRALGEVDRVEHVVGLDIAPSALERARARGGPKTEFVLGDFFKLGDGLEGTFDWLVEHTCFCAIPRAWRPAYVEAAAGALRPGGQFLGIFYLDPGQARAESGPPFESRVGELDRLFEDRFETVKQWLPTRTYPGREGREWIRWMRRRS